jgi:hypothetical protein
MDDLIVCTRCKVPKESSEFWFDKRRGKVRKPCRTCSSKRDSLTNKVRNANGIITRSDILNHYKKKDLSEDTLLFFTDLLLLNRAIKKMEKPLVKSDGIFTHVFCPICGDYESVELPCGVDNLIGVLSIFAELHKHDDI